VKAFLTPDYVSPQDHVSCSDKQRLTLLFVQISPDCWMRTKVRIPYEEAIEPIDPDRFIPFGAGILTSAMEAVSRMRDEAVDSDAIDGARLLRHIAAQLVVLDMFGIGSTHPDAEMRWRECRACELQLA
jgi:hypothetical protein